jgi:hypothetical protein
MMSMACTDCHQKPGEARPVVSCRDCHDKVHGLHAKGAHPETPCAECHKPHAWTVTGRDPCLSCHSDMKEHNAAKGACVACHSFRAGTAGKKQ